MKKHLLIISLIWCFAILSLGCGDNKSFPPNNNVENEIIDFSNVITEIKNYLLDNGLVFENNFVVEQKPTTAKILISEEYVIDVDYLIEIFKLEFSYEDFIAKVKYEAPFVIFDISKEKE